MKKLFLLALATASTASMFGQDYVNNINDKFREGVSLTVEWANLDEVGNGNVRVGNGANDMFYLNDYTANTLKVYNELGLEKTMTIPSDFMWVCNNIDNAGNVIVRGSTEVWPGTGSYKGCFYAGTAGNLIFIVDGKTNEWVNVKYDMDAGPSARWDAFGHVMYDALAEGFWNILATSDGGSTGMITDFIFNGTEKAFVGAETSYAVNSPSFTGTTSEKFTTLGSGQYTGECDDEGFYYTAAVYGNPYAGLTGFNPTGKDLSNGIQLYNYIEEEGVFKWDASGQYYITPQHSDIGGFMVFTLGGKEYVVYPAGNFSTHAGDAIGIAEAAFTDTPEGDNAIDVKHLVARSYGAANDAGNPKYIAASMHQCLNVQPVEGDPNSVYIYCYTSGCPMVKFKFTVMGGDGAGVEDVTVNNDANAPIEYYNISGVRVANPAAGNIYIRKQGTSVAKVVF
ncbi:MAG: hypothetical protein K2K22_06520 [Muribaculaceae bacterium]|nr:hypothetical protein [Muribaculaceae bacterium]